MPIAETAAPLDLVLESKGGRAVYLRVRSQIMTTEPVVQLKRELRAAAYFALSFGAIVGVGWVVVLGDWLNEAGPIGSIVAFATGGMVVLLVGFCYGEMTARRPVSGGEVAYTYEIFGVRTCFATGWFLALGYLSTTVFEAVSVAWVASALAPGIQGPVIYSFNGSPVYLGSLLLGLGGMILITLLNYRGISPAARLQNALTYSKIMLIILIFVVGLGWGKLSHLEPLFRRDGRGSIWPGMLSVFLTVPFWMSGFNTVAQVMEEKAQRTSLKLVGSMIVLSIVAATFFYCLIILASSMTMPWENLLKLDLPAARGFEVAYRSPLLSRSVLLVALFGNITVWNSVFLSSTRVLFALGRAQIISKRFGVIQASSHVPGKAILFMGTVGCLGVFSGKGAILPVVNVASSCYALSYLMVCLGVIAKRRQHKVRAAYEVPGGIITAVAATVTSAFILFLSFYQPFVEKGRSIPVEWWLIILWAGLGTMFWFLARGLRQGVTEGERRAIILETDQSALELRR
jgi:APA family basic amino acid/polyamine antiporter